MQELPTTHPPIYQKFEEGKFMVRRTDNFWAGIFTDLHIKQVYMGHIKSQGNIW